MTKLSKSAQDQIVQELDEGVETLPQAEFDDLYEQLDAEHQMQVRDNIREFADDAVGSPGSSCPRG
jgi:hypothetical protein